MRTPYLFLLLLPLHLADRLSMGHLAPLDLLVQDGPRLLDLLRLLDLVPLDAHCLGSLIPCLRGTPGPDLTVAVGRVSRIRLTLRFAPTCCPRCPATLPAALLHLFLLLQGKVLLQLHGDVGALVLGQVPPRQVQ